MRVSLLVAFESLAYASISLSFSFTLAFALSVPRSVSITAVTITFRIAWVSELTIFVVTFDAETAFCSLSVRIVCNCVCCSG